RAHQVGQKHVASEVSERLDHYTPPGVRVPLVRSAAKDVRVADARIPCAIGRAMSYPRYSEESPRDSEGCIWEESKPDSVGDDHLSQSRCSTPSAKRMPRTLASASSVISHASGCSEGDCPFHSPIASGTRLCGSSHRLPGPGLRQALCSVLSGLSSPSISERPPFLPHRRPIARALGSVYHGPEDHPRSSRMSTNLGPELSPDLLEFFS